VSVVDRILASPKYRGVHRALVERLFAEVAERPPREAEEQVRRELHRLYGAFQTGKPRYRRWLRALAGAGDPMAELRRLVRNHASTREREPQLEGFYEAVFGAVGPVSRVVDLGCGLNPLTRAWAPVDPGVTWFGCDVDADQLAFVEAAARAVGHPVEVAPTDLVAPTSLPSGDVAFLFKVIPCLHPSSWEPGADLVERLDVGAVVVSLPGATLGGRKRGMAAANQQRFEQLAARRGWVLRQLEVPVDELVWVVDRSAA
jgi:16S rRNA (guanine(1405)-N(7))-methyltransferase